MKNNIHIHKAIKSIPKDATCFGYCSGCNEVHHLTEGSSRKYALELMAELEEHKRIDFHSADYDPIFSTDCLWGDRGGQMFGVLECVDSLGNIVVLRAFSGQFNTRWEANGWVPPAFDLDSYYELLPKTEESVQQMTYEIEACKQEVDQCKIILEEALQFSEGSYLKDCRNNMKKAQKKMELTKKKRKAYSQSMLLVFQDLYKLNNFKGDQQSIRNIFNETRGIPIGSGDCCAPKLLQAAAQKKLTPLGMTEFYFGKENKSSTRHHKEFYPSCETKCQPILGYMLCGL